MKGPLILVPIAIIDYIISFNSQIEFPSGATIKFDTIHWYGDTHYANIEVNVPSDDFGNTVGLCGTFDGNAGNELTDRFGVSHDQGHWRVGIAPERFTESWR